MTSRADFALSFADTKLVDFLGVFPGQTKRREGGNFVFHHFCEMAIGVLDLSKNDSGGREIRSTLRLVTRMLGHGLMGSSYQRCALARHTIRVV